MKKKNIMREFKLHEISAVDKPAQEGAKAAIMKRAPIIDEDIITKSVAGIQYLATDFAYVPDLKKSETWALRLTSTPGGDFDQDLVTKAINEAVEKFREEIPTEDQEAIIETLSKAWLDTNPDKTENDLPDLLNKSTLINKQENDMDPKTQALIDEAVKKAVESATATHTQELEKAKKEAELNDAEKSLYGKMNDVEKSAFLAKSAADRKNDIAKAAELDSVVYKSADGTEYRKSAGDQMISLAKAADEANKIAKAEREARETSELKKRAGDLFKSLPGDENVKAALLKSVESISDEKVRKDALAAIQAGDTAISAAFTRKGASVGNSESGSANDQLDALAKAYAADKKVAYSKAYDEVLKTEEGKALYNQTIKA